MRKVLALLLSVVMALSLMVTTAWADPVEQDLAGNTVILHTNDVHGDIAKYAKGWNFARIPLVASAIMRVAMYEILYMPEIPNGAAINEAVEIAKKYETPETVKFINGILGTFVRQEISE